MPHEFLKLALAIAQKARPCRYHQASGPWRTPAMALNTTLSRERHQTPIPSLNSEAFKNTPPRAR